MTLSTRVHTPLSGTENVDASTLNAIFDQLDGAIVTTTITGTAGETLSERDFVYLASDNTWYKMDTDNVSGGVKAGIRRGIVTESGGITSAATGEIKLSGLVDGFTGLSAWGLLYASTTAGGYTQTKPAVTDGGNQIAFAVMGVAISTTAIVLNPRPIKYLKRSTLADNAELTIEHHSNPQTRSRSVQAYVGDSYDEPLWIGSISGDSAEVGVEYGDGSQADEDTKTTFKNLTGSSADLTCIVEIA